MEPGWGTDTSTEVVEEDGVRTVCLSEGVGTAAAGFGTAAAGYGLHSAGDGGNRGKTGKKPVSNLDKCREMDIMRVFIRICDAQ